MDVRRHSIYLVSNDRVRWRQGHQAAGVLAPEQGDPGHGELWTNLAARPHQPAQSGIYGGEEASESRDRNVTLAGHLTIAFIVIVNII